MPRGTYKGANDDWWIELGARIRACREEVGYTQQELADLIGRTRTVVTSVELGNTRVDLFTLCEIATLLGKQVGRDLLDGMEVQLTDTQKQLKALFDDKREAQQVSVEVPIDQREANRQKRLSELKTG